ncbi:MAG: tRNA-dihydrouridine synthase [Methanobrevibacter sp.]|uniref:MJ0144 family RNA dihydrouridine synthase-like protein n=1 Tax=Methanobrevibacter sp. TaxID=66852 RepID=UPI0026DEFE6E|nr:MJ0144 family RNA dihydrouridine synthase-like protein [Methanobrevibacter sp.]MDO5848184.1 tRNA-dihydrouridine synthase [Methanobrevibacter sp.]
MAGITDAAFLNKVIPFGFDVATLGGFNLDEPTIEASGKILERGRKEFHFPKNLIFTHIANEASSIKDKNDDVKVSVNVRSTTPNPIIRLDEIEDLDIIEINCHCRQPEFLEIGCGQNMLQRNDLGEFISEVVDNVSKEVSVKIRANVVDDLAVCRIIQDSGADYLHVDAMKPGVFDADYELLTRLCSNLDIPVIGNNSIDSEEKIIKMLNTGISGFSIARAVISGKLDFNISDF